MKFLATIILLCPFFVSAQESTALVDSFYNANKAIVFKKIPSAQTYKSLNHLAFNRMKIDTLLSTVDFKKDNYFIDNKKASNKSISLFIIPSKEDSSLIFLYTELNGIKYYNWIQLKLYVDSLGFSGMITLISMENKILKTWHIKHDRTIIVGKEQIDSFVIISGRKRYPASPMIIMSSAFDGKEYSVNRNLCISLFYTVFNEKIPEKSNFSNIYFVLNSNYKYLFLMPLGHKNNTGSSGLHAIIKQIYKKAKN
jgi:hypothetical protein